MCTCVCMQTEPSACLAGVQSIMCIIKSQHRLNNSLLYIKHDLNTRVIPWVPGDTWNLRKNRLLDTIIHPPKWRNFTYHQRRREFIKSIVCSKVWKYHWLLLCPLRLSIQSFDCRQQRGSISIPLRLKQFDAWVNSITTVHCDENSIRKNYVTAFCRHQVLHKRRDNVTVYFST